MPELPEVETIKSGLSRFLMGEKLAGIKVLLPKMVIGEYRRAIDGEVEKINRYAKVLEIKLNNGFSLLFHLKLTGQLILIDDKKTELAGGHPVPPLDSPVPNSSTRIILFFASGAILYFNDLRQFGWLKVVPSEKVKEEKLIKTLGPEPLSERFTKEYLGSTLSKTKRAVKTVLMDQSKISGLGNIYSDEALWWARIRPDREASSLTPAEVEKLHFGIKKATVEGIKHRGSSLQSYVTVEGEKGTYLHVAKVYNRKNCPECGGKVATKRIGGRTAHFCPSCQK